MICLSLKVLDGKIVMMNNEEILDDIDSHSTNNLENFSLDKIYSSIVLRENSIENILHEYFIKIDDVIQSESTIVSNNLSNIRDCMIKTSQHIRDYMIEVFLRESTSAFISDLDISKIEREKSYVKYSCRVIEEYNNIQKHLTEIYHELYS
jgi:hypothetical protein